MKYLLITMWHVPHDVLLCADSTISFLSLTTRRQLITSAPNRISMRNLSASVWYRWHKLPLRSIRIVSSNACLNKPGSFILRPRHAEHPVFLTSRAEALSVVSVNTDLIKCVMPLPLRLIFATFSWSLSAAHQHPGIPMRPTDWQQHKSRGCIKNTLGQRKELRLRLSDGEYLLWNELSAGVLMHHHRFSDNVVTYGLTECTPKHF